MLLAEARLANWFVDAATVFGVVGTLFGILGTIATLVGLWWTWQQVQETKKAAEAARDAALATAAADRSEYTRYVVSTCHRLIREAKIYVESHRYSLAAIRLGDMADQLAIIGRVSPELIQNWKNAVEDLRLWESTLIKRADDTRRLSAHISAKWVNFLQELSAIVDQVHGPHLLDAEEFE